MRLTEELLVEAFSVRVEVDVEVAVGDGAESDLAAAAAASVAAVSVGDVVCDSSGATTRLGLPDPKCWKDVRKIGNHPDPGPLSITPNTES